MVVQPLEFAGKSWEVKVTDLRENMAGKEQSAMVVTEHDEIAWLFNLRGEGFSTVEVIKASYQREG